MEHTFDRHLLRRTNKKGVKGIFVCDLCGMENLTLKDMNDECTNERGLTPFAALAEAITGKDN